MVTDLIGGQIQVGITGLPAVQQHVKAGTLKLIAITTAQRMPAYPAFPTIAEQGFPGFAAAPWAGFFAPKGTPPPIVPKVSADLVEVMLLPDVQQKMQDIGSQLVPHAGGIPQVRRRRDREVERGGEGVRRERRLGPEERSA